MQAILNWMISSATFRKFSGGIGWFTVGMWTAANYHREIRGTLELWGVPHSSAMKAMVIIIGAALGTGSVALTVVNQRRLAASGVDPATQSLKKEDKQ